MLKKLKHGHIRIKREGKKDNKTNVYCLIFNTNKGPKDYWTISSRNKKNTFKHYPCRNQGISSP